MHLLTRALLNHGVVFLLSTAAGDGDAVEAARHQRLKHTLCAELRHRECVNGSLLVSQSHRVVVHVSFSRSPRHTEEVHAAVVAHRHVSHSGGN